MFWFLRGKRKLGLALSGGTSRGIAHVGVLKVLLKNNIPISYIAGTSAGAIVAALYATGMDIRDIERSVMEMDWLKIISPTFTWKGVFSSQKIETMMRGLLPVRTFGETRIPLSIVATDFLNAQEYVFRKKDEDIALAVRASATIPGVFDPVHYEGKVLVDGCLTNNMPVSVVKKMGADTVLGVNVISGQLTKEPDNMFRVLSWANDIYEISNAKKYRTHADLILEPLPEPIDIFTSSKALYKKLVTLGEEAAEKNIGTIKRLL